MGSRFDVAPTELAHILLCRGYKDLAPTEHREVCAFEQRWPEIQSRKGKAHKRQTDWRADARHSVWIA